MGCWCGEEGAWTRVVKPVTEEGKEGVNDRRFLSWTSGGCLHFLKYGTVVALKDAARPHTAGPSPCKALLEPGSDS